MFSQILGNFIKGEQRPAAGFSAFILFNSIQAIVHFFEHVNLHLNVSTYSDSFSYDYLPHTSIKQSSKHPSDKSSVVRSLPEKQRKLRSWHVTMYTWPIHRKPEFCCMFFIYLISWKNEKKAIHREKLPMCPQRPPAETGDRSNRSVAHLRCCSNGRMHDGARCVTSRSRRKALAENIRN